MLYFVVVFAFFPSCKKEFSCENCNRDETKNGGVIFYSVDGCINNKPIHLTIDDNINLLVDIFGTRPECSTTGTHLIFLTPSIHTWVASCDVVGTIAGGMIDVLPNSCQVEQIK